MIYSWLTVLYIDGETAICSVNVKPDMTGDRPTHLGKQEIELKLADLKLVHKSK